MTSILTSIKKLLGIAEEYEHFDADIIMHINGVFGTLSQLGIGPPNGFAISDKSSVWSEFIGNEILLESVKTYVYKKVRLAFDPPTNSAALESLQRMIAEDEWRLNVQSDRITQSSGQNG